MEQLGRGHGAIRRLRALRRDAARRRAEGVYLAEGFHLAAEALACGVPIEEVLLSQRAARHAEGRSLIRRFETGGVACRMTSETILDSLQDTRSPQPILLVLRRPEWTLEPVLAAHTPPALITVACSVQDPGNLGAILRSTDAANGTALIAIGAGADLFHPRAVRASMGSIFRLPTLQADPDEACQALRRAGIRLLGADPSRGTPHHACDLRGPTAFLLGTEGQGLPAALRDRLEGRLRVPMREGVNSLSVGAAAAVLLFEAARQRATRRDDG